MPVGVPALPRAPATYEQRDQDRLREALETVLRKLDSVEVTASGGLPTRQTATFTTASLATGATETGTIDMGSSTSVLLKITVSRVCRARFYATSAARTADASRLAGTDPPPGAGVLAEFIFTFSGTIDCGPPPVLYNGDSPSADTIYYSITNTGSTGTVQVDLLHVDAET